MDVSKAVVYIGVKFALKVESKVEDRKSKVKEEVKGSANSPIMNMIIGKDPNQSQI
ncbi:predicted protein [Sclerotinia sclerotiorum 1980 UF-70]|uniref:Uncharacterized protein n=1 Tax=Sclerotinia sclerotiorum (strain ATCC 18683 / 1980 / Ss-1) TaxID=665079 RepID=A7F102_SCLS1|nr:predicted protein [Sclerotinia sclerotiorum 1980 UF-70]EDN95394.1 predicted protein [Sclerotinia sclerotiorum 1980 UF-70]